MKLCTTTTTSVNLAAKLVLVFVSVLMVFSMLFQMTQRVSADKYDDKINALKQDIEKYKLESERLNGQAATLKSAIAQLANQKATIQVQIDINQAKYNKLLEQIRETEKNIKDNQDALGDIIAKIYVDDDITPLEMIASSDSIGDYMDKQTFRSSVRNQLTTTISEIKDLKTTLDKKKNEVVKILSEQKSQCDSLLARENEKNSLLRKTNGQEANYQKLISDSQSEIAEAKATQALINSRFNSNGGYVLISSGLLGDYPWKASNCPMWSYFSTGGSDGNGSDGGADGIGSDGYGCRQCASYVAWRIAKETGKYYLWGNAVDFTENAIAAGYTEGIARAGSIAVMDPGKAGQSFGHVAWVEAASGDMVTISQYNYDYGAGYGMYSMMTLPNSAFDHYVYIK